MTTIEGISFVDLAQRRELILDGSRTGRVAGATPRRRFCFILLAHNKLQALEMVLVAWCCMVLHSHATHWYDWNCRQRLQAATIIPNKYRISRAMFPKIHRGSAPRRRD